MQVRKNIGLRGHAGLQRRGVRLALGGGRERLRLPRGARALRPRGRKRGR